MGIAPDPLVIIARPYGGGSIPPPLPVGQQGAWECPRCHVINAWWVARCSCKPAPTHVPRNRRFPYA